LKYFLEIQRFAKSENTIAAFNALSLEKGWRQIE